MLDKKQLQLHHIKNLHLCTCKLLIFFASSWHSLVELLYFFFIPAKNFGCLTYLLQFSLIRLYILHINSTIIHLPRCRICPLPRLHIPNFQTKKNTRFRKYPKAVCSFALLPTMALLLFIHQDALPLFRYHAHFTDMSNQFFCHFRNLVSTCLAIIYQLLKLVHCA